MNIIDIKTYIKSKRITYNQLSELSGIPLSTLKSIFSGTTANPRLDTLNAIQKALGISDDLLNQPTILHYRTGYKNILCLYDNSGDVLTFNFDKAEYEKIKTVCEAITKKITQVFACVYL